MFVNNRVTIQLNCLGYYPILCFCPNIIKHYASFDFSKCLSVNYRLYDHLTVYECHWPLCCKARVAYSGPLVFLFSLPEAQTLAYFPIFWAGATQLTPYYTQFSPPLSTGRVFRPISI